MGSEPIDKMADVLLNLQGLSDGSASTAASRRSILIQIDVLLEVQAQMQEQLRLHDSQIAAMRDLIASLRSPNPGR